MARPGEAAAVAFDQALGGRAPAARGGGVQVEAAVEYKKEGGPNRQKLLIRRILTE
jgi:hypothetical protein